MRADIKKQLLILPIFAVLLFLDALSKFLTVKYVAHVSFFHPFYPYGGIGIFKDFLGISFSLNYIENTGAAWGLFSGYAIYLFFLRLFVALGLIFYLFFFNKDKRSQLPLWLVVTGAFGNILDYLFYGHVVDMFKFVFGSYHYPLFNLADSMIAIGIFWFLINSLRKK